MLYVTTRIDRPAGERSDRWKGPHGEAMTTAAAAESSTRTRDMNRIMRFNSVRSNARWLVVVGATTMSLGAARGGLAQAGLASAPLPARDVDDPGVVATGQRITPAGLQMAVSYTH